MDKAGILDEIRRCSAANSGVAPGRARFEQETGITERDWSGKHWARWGDAIREAGFEPNTLNQPYTEDHLLTKLAELTRDLGRFPTAAERRLRRREDPSFPSPNTFARFGRNADVAARLALYCDGRPEWDEVRAICEAVAAHVAAEINDAPGGGSMVGVVYLMRSGRHYKIGRSNSVGRRAYELAIQLPERLELVHAIETDDPVGIERYWHDRFADRRANGEWFNLTKPDVAAFRRRRRFM